MCLDVINQTWSPMFDLINVFEVFLPQLLLYPNPTDPLNGEAAALLMRDPAGYAARVKGGRAAPAGPRFWLLGLLALLPQQSPPGSCGRPARELQFGQWRLALPEVRGSPELPAPPLAQIT